MLDILPSTSGQIHYALMNHRSPPLSPTHGGSNGRLPIAESIQTTPMTFFAKRNRSFAVNSRTTVGLQALDHGGSSELVRQIRALRGAIADDADMEADVRSRRQRCPSGSHPLDLEAREHDIDYDILRDLRAAFTTTTSSSTGSSG
jgi:hypothetical protein